LQTFSISQITKNFARFKPNQEKQGESISQFGKGCKLKQDNKRSDKYQIFNPNKSTIQSTDSGKESLQDRLGKTEQKRAEITKEGDQRSCFQGHRAL
jgi:hypothetical protein